MSPDKVPSLAFCPIDRTASIASGANEDQYSCFSSAISECMPDGGKAHH
jgi:hypothetical protein